MSYTSERVAGTKVNDVSFEQLGQFFQALGATHNLSGGLTPFFWSPDWQTNRGLDIDNNVLIKLNKQELKVKNTTRWDNDSYNVYDLIAAAKTSGVEDRIIADALNAAGIPGGTRSMSVDGRGIRLWTPSDVINANTNTTPLGKIADKINENNPGANARVITKLNNAGSDYNFELVYTSPNGKQYSVPIENYKTSDGGFLNKDGTIDEPRLNTFMQSNNINSAIAAGNAAQNNTAFNETAQMLRNQFLNDNSTLGSNANANRGTVTGTDRAAITANAPSTKNLQSWQAVNGSNAPNYAQQLSDLSQVDYTAYGMTPEQYQALRNATNSNNTAAIAEALRNINRSQQNTQLNNVNNLADLITALNAQRTQDVGAGVIAGQQAANAGAQVNATNQANAESNAELYNALFGENNAAAALRDQLYTNNVTDLDTYIKSVLSEGMRQAANYSQNTDRLAELLPFLRAGLDADMAAYNRTASDQDAIAEAAKDRINAIESAQALQDIAEQDAALQIVADVYGVTKNYLANAIQSGDTSAIAAIDAVKQSIKSGDLNITNQSGATPNYSWTPAQLERNQQLENLTNSDLWDRVNNFTTRSDHNADVLKSLGLDQYLGTPTGLQNEYQTFADTANRASNRVFNQAQRAYLSAIAAGDTQTADTLTNLALSSGSSRRNLYGAEALATQYRQQLRNRGAGLNLATDYQNQQTANNTLRNQAVGDAANARTGYLGTGNEVSGMATIAGIQDLLANANSKVQNLRSNLGASAIGAGSAINDTQSALNRNNYTRGMEITNNRIGLNANGSANNIKNQGARKALGVDLNAGIEATKTKSR